VNAERPAPRELSRPTKGSAHHRDRLRYLAETDEGVTGPAHGKASGVDPQGLDERTAAVARVASLVALRAAPASYRRSVDLALAAGATVDEVVDTLKVVARTVGLARVVSAAPELALALGYDIDRALEAIDNPRTGDTKGLVRGVGVQSRQRATEGPTDAVGDPTA
jgi:4-carboxymuconolactone decarboxylase